MNSKTAFFSYLWKDLIKFQNSNKSLDLRASLVGFWCETYLAPSALFHLKCRLDVAVKKRIPVPIILAVWWHNSTFSIDGGNQLRITEVLFFIQTGCHFICWSKWKSYACDRIVWWRKIPSKADSLNVANLPLSFAGKCTHVCLQNTSHIFPFWPIDNIYRLQNTRKLS